VEIRGSTRDIDEARIQGDVLTTFDDATLSDRVFAEVARAFA
jgi:hypothetical protein